MGHEFSYWGSPMLIKNNSINITDNEELITLNKITYSSSSSSITQELDKNNKESRARLDVSLGARFNF
ncbi:hypothetical protein [Pedobacter sp. UBA4863]|uniref:hypothetical protein n=1 Tax=Pedobacter sp. UBA4863 TaxID=1947060 RepID=UPI0025DBEC12|nr:hypothetical protein [Pedobacter sp. UBA4863]